MANKYKTRLKKLEKEMGVSDYGLRVIVPPDCFYDDADAVPYWTDEPIKHGMDYFYQDKPYREVEHPDGKKAVMGVFHGK